MKELNSIQGELKAPKNQFNSFGKYKYRSAEDILEGVKPLLSKYKCILTASDEIVNIGERFYIKATATLSNADGETVSVTAFAREEETKKGMDGAQVTGSSSSYARKYAYNGLFCIDDTKDPDSTNKHGKETQTANKPKATSKPKVDHAKEVEKITDGKKLKAYIMKNYQSFPAGLLDKAKEKLFKINLNVYAEAIANGKITKENLQKRESLTEDQIYTVMNKAMELIEPENNETKK